MEQTKELMGFTSSKDDRDRVDWKSDARWIEAQLTSAGALAKTESERGYLLEHLANNSLRLAASDDTLERTRAVGEARRARKAELTARKQGRQP